VTRSPRKYVLDTQLFINAFRDPGANERLQAFHRALSPFEYLSVIVAQELRAGLKRPQDRKALERNVLKIFTRAGRTIALSADAWHRSGDLLAEMVWQEGLEVSRVTKAFAISCWRCRAANPVACLSQTTNGTFSGSAGSSGLNSPRRGRPRLMRHDDARGCLRRIIDGAIGSVSRRAAS
jgi:predicted nucleic acid-binding protein